MVLGAGLLIGLAAGAAAGGWWLPGGIALAAAVAGLAVWRRPAELPALRLAVLISLAAMTASTFAVYLVPAQPVLASSTVIALMTAALLTGAEVRSFGRRLLAGVLLAAAAVFVAVCFAIGRPGSGDYWAVYTPDLAMPFQTRPMPVPGLPGPAGVLSAAVVLFALFTTLTPDLPRRTQLLRIGAGAGVAVAVAAAALYQLGAFRLGLSPTTLRDVLAAAEASGLGTLLDALVVVVTVPVLLMLLTAARDELAKVWQAPSAARTVVAGALAALLAAVLVPAIALVVASTFALGATLLGWIKIAAGARRAPAGGSGHQEE